MKDWGVRVRHTAVAKGSYMLLGQTVRNAFYFSTGLGMLGLVSAKHNLQGYTTPTGFSATDWPRAIGHAQGIVADYAKHAALYRPGMTFAGLDVLELGPGATLATGVLIAGLGARSYLAVDAFPLARGTPAGFYQALVEAEADTGIDRTRLAAAAEALNGGRDSPVAYAVDPEFQVRRAAPGRSFDLIVSNAAFEHFDDIERTIADISAVAAPGALFMAMIDFQTHTRWVRENDPNNIYRFPAPLYRALAFKGQPNRRRPRDYVAALEAHGWINPVARGIHTAPPGYSDWSQRGLAPQFRDAGAQMDVLTGVVLAARPG